jgi:gamma-glutamyl hydrolase
MAGGSCFSNVYDKWVQSAGARAVGIPHDAIDSNSSALDDLLESLDGVIFTGGGLNLSMTRTTYFRTGKYIFEWVQAHNDKGFYFPAHGHCMGFQFLAVLAAGSNSSVLSSNAFDSEDLSLPLEWTPSAAQSRWVQRMPKEVHKTLTDLPSTTNLHHDGVKPSVFDGNPSLNNFFQAVSTNRDRNGSEFISTMEAKSYPILAVQFHPERNQFEWTEELNINHEAEAVAANSWMARDFINEAWKHIKAHKSGRVRNMALLRKMTTYSMHQMRVGDVLDGLSYLMYEGFSSSQNFPEEKATLPHQRGFIL